MAAATKLFIENGLDTALWLVLDASDGTLSITAYDAAPHGKKADQVPPGKAATYRVTEALKACYRGTKLEYTFRNRCGKAILFTGGRQRTKEGPIFRIEPLLN
jgi:hypothetical protein